MFEAESSRMFELPSAGAIRVGRGHDVELRLRGTGISRHHALIRTDAGETVLVDEGSQNGTRINGERVIGARPLASGDEIGICATTLVFHGSPVPRSPGMLDLRGFRQRFMQEVERSRLYRRPLTLVSLTLGPADRPRVELALAEGLRTIDIPAWEGGDQLTVLMPELAGEAALEAAARLLAIVKRAAPSARAGLASWPADGIDIDTLLEAARTSALDARRSAVAPAALAYRTLDLSDRQVIVADPAMLRHYELIERLAPSQLAVLICGETGTGKELAARALHEWSSRRGRPLVAINCGALADSLIESELFGHQRGAFTGAVSNKIGLLEQAAGGTVFLDEVGELSAITQGKLLRVIEHKVVTPLGGTREREIDIRVVAATNRDLDAEVRAGRFRQDLYFRLSGGTIWLPPLRERRREISILAHRLLEQACGRMHCETKTLSDDAVRLLWIHDWPGNVRELQNVMEYLAAAVTDHILEPWHIEERIGRRLNDTLQANSGPDADLAMATAPPHFRAIEDEVRDLESARMRAALQASGGHQRRAAELIAMPLRTFQTKSKLYGLSCDPRRRR